MLCCCCQGLIHSLTQGLHGEGREQWRKAGRAAKAGGEWDSQSSVNICCCQAFPPALCCRLGSISSAVRHWGTSTADDPVPALLCHTWALPCSLCHLSFCCCLCVFPADPGSISLVGTWGGLRAGNGQGGWISTLSFRSHMGLWQRSWWCPKRNCPGGEEEQ